jgi:hypothetical protein
MGLRGELIGASASMSPAAESAPTPARCAGGSTAAFFRRHRLSWQLSAETTEMGLPTR